MKKLTTLFAALFLCLGMAQAQDVYYSGNGNGIGKIWKNDSLLYSLTDSINIQLKAIQVADSGTVYGAGYVFDTVGIQGRIWMNDSCVFNSGANTYFDHLVLTANGWTAAGFNNIWQNGELLYSYSHGEDECHIQGLAVDTTTDDIYAGGAISFASDSLFHASIWKNDSLLWMEDTISSVQSICFGGGNIYSAGFMIENDTLYGVVWQNDSIIYLIENANFGHIAEFNGSLYWTGISLNDTIVYIWQDGDVLYALPELSGISNLVVNESGVYYTDAQTVYKDGEILYQPGCIITDLFVILSETPQPLFTLTVEADTTGWGTVTGGGTYPLGDTITIEAFPNLGCEFLYWNDSITDNPLDVVITQDSTFIAHFGLIDYTITTSVDPDSTGIVTEGGIFHYGDTLTLEVIPNEGYIFEMWNDSITDNPRDIIVTQDSTFIAHLIPIGYTIETSADPEDAGTVTGSGVYPYGDTVTLAAVPNVGFVFDMWNDSIADNPRDIVVTQDSAFVAHFIPMQCLIETLVVPEGTGIVTGGGLYTYGDTIQLEAIPNLGFEFLTWGDDNSDNPRTIVVTESQTFTATFGVKQCVVNTEVTPAEGGIVLGGGTYSYGDTILLVAQNNVGFSFKIWEDEIFDNPRQIIVEDDVTYTAIFSPLQFQITTGSEPANGGSVEGGGIYNYGEIATLYARPFNNYSFLCWSDGIVSNPRYITVTQDAEYKAIFQFTGTPEYAIKVIANNYDWGSVEGTGIYPEGTIVEISATPTDSTQFVRWDDGNTDNPRTITVTSEMLYTAIFEPLPVYTITVRSISTNMGTVYGGGTYRANTVIEIGAVPEDGFYFTGWQDNDMNNPRSITVTEDAEYIAHFSQTPTPTYTVTVYFDENQGFILGAGTYSVGSTATLAAIPADGYMFVKWSDDTTDNPKEVIVDHDIILAAFFTGTSVDENGLGSISLYPNPANDIIHIDGLEGEHEVQIYNALGLLVMTTTLQGDSEINICDLPSGYYLIRIDNHHSVKFIKRTNK